MYYVCYVIAYNHFAKIKKVGLETLRQANLGDKLIPAFDKVMSVQQTAMDYQQGAYFHIFLTK